MDDLDVVLLRALFNAYELGKGMSIAALADKVGISIREARERLEDLARQHYVHLNEARGARTATLLPGGKVALQTSQINIHRSNVQLGHSNLQTIESSDDDDEDDDDEEDLDEDEDDEDDTDDEDDEE